MLGITIVNIGSLAWQYTLLADIQADPDNYNEQTANISDTLQTVLSIASFRDLHISNNFFHYVVQKSLLKFASTAMA